MIQTAGIVKEKTSAPEISYVRENYARGVKVPWRVKMALKILFAKIPLSYALWTSLGIFRHGDTSRNLTNLHNSFEHSYNIYKDVVGKAPETVLELGPGDSIGHALSAKAKGMRESWLVDVGDFATTDEEHYRRYHQQLGLDSEPVSFSREDVLAYTNAHYMTGGLWDLKLVPTNSVDLSFSTAVLEHVRRAEFQDHMNELFRVHKAGSFSCHWVDLHDHLGGALNSMQFSPELWETKHVQQAGFYTNRLTMDEMLDCAITAGFTVEVKKVIQWKTLPTPTSAMHESFARKSATELNVCTFLMYLSKPT
jgi:predicted SAM-dependent methyltransferase